MLVHPREKTRSAVAMSCSSVTFLFTTSRMRWLPASGAKVMPLARTCWMSSSVCSPRPYARSELTPSETRSGASRSVTFLMSGAMHE
jgi:hypothetical protein